MKLKSILLVICLISVAILGGCKDDTPPPANIENQKKVIETYLNALQEGDQEKLYTTLSSEMIIRYTKDPEALNSIFDAQKNLGKMQKWEFNGEQYVDELNNQSIIDATITYPKAVYTVTFDLRRIGDKWQVVTIESKSKEKVN